MQRFEVIQADTWIAVLAVIANKVKQSVTSECMDCRAAARPEPVEGLALTQIEPSLRGTQ